MKKIFLLIATFCGLGYVPFAPGTVGSLASFIIWGPLIFFKYSFWIRFLILIIVIIIAILSSNESVKYFKIKDPKQIVIDEVAGMGVVLLFVDSEYFIAILGFILFRFFDILKPWPIKKIEKLPNGFGVVLDDIMAGIYSLFFLILIKKFL